MMAQYLALKAEAADCLLFYRMGDFFELFHDDAKIAAAVLDIALTARGEHEGAKIPMCGVPIHAAEGYLARLIKAGHRVAIAEQVETPEEAKKRGGSKTLVARAIVRTPTGRRTEISWSAEALPRCYQWVLPTRGGWALGIEPANAPLFGPERDDAGTRAVLLAPGESVETAVSIAHEEGTP